jgi:hypothetical protein
MIHLIILYLSTSRNLETRFVCNKMFCFQFSLHFDSYFKIMNKFMYQYLKNYFISSNLQIFLKSISCDKYQNKK